MSDTVISVDGISKLYRLGEVGTGSLKDDISRWWYSLRGKDNPFLMVGEENDRLVKGNCEYVWALNDISFDVKKGEVLGIIGRNGAGKSTLLKILSRTTAPTKGSIKLKGRIASLLEVGTGFHPELSGRDNIYLNGAILGMSKHEIKSKFDEIVDFSGVERYIDTPVKRYSSGMYVRLAFAVAAHLEPDILIVDEVLAVGDTEFQNKCIGKMQSVSKNEGRTILFVSHNLSAVKALCSRAIVMEKGSLALTSSVESCMSYYFASQLSSKKKGYVREGNRKAEILSYTLQDNLGQERQTFMMGEDLVLNLKLRINVPLEDIELGINVKDNNHDFIFHLCNYDDNTIISGDAGDEYTLEVVIPSNQLTPKTYFFDFGIVIGEERLDILEGAIEFFIVQGNIVKRRNSYPTQTRYYSSSVWNLSPFS